MRKTDTAAIHNFFRIVVVMSFFKLVFIGTFNRDPPTASLVANNATQSEVDNVFH